MAGRGASLFGWNVMPVVHVIFYVLMFVGAAGFLVVVSRKHAPTARLEPFRKPNLIRAAGVLLFAAAGILISTFDGTPDNVSNPGTWLVLLQTGLAVAGVALAVIGGLKYRRAGAAYPPGKHADPHSASERRRL